MKFEPMLKDDLAKSLGNVPYTQTAPLNLVGVLMQLTES